MIGENNTITIKRFEKTSAKKVTKATIVTGLGAYIESTKPELSPIYNDDASSETFGIFVEFFDVEIGDEITDQNGKVYTILGRSKFENDELNPHTEIIAKSKYVNQSPDAS